MNELRFALTDFETNRPYVPKTPELGEIISGAVIVVDAMTLEEISGLSGTWNMHPRWPENNDPDALAVNGYTPEEWDRRGVVTHEQFLTEFLQIITGTVFFAQNVVFDRSFINAELARQNMDWTGHYHSYDLASLALPLLWTGRVTKLKLASMCEMFKISNDNEHDAYTDVRRMQKVLKRLRQIDNLLPTVSFACAMDSE